MAIPEPPQDLELPFDGDRVDLQHQLQYSPIGSISGLTGVPETQS
jgi:hypothetical protein